MHLSRRSLLAQLGIGVATSATAFTHSDQNSAALELAKTSGASELPIRLNRNENPYGPSADVLEAMKEALRCSNRFPDIAELVSAICSFHGIRTEELTVGAGSQEILRMAVQEFLGPGKNIVLPSPSFEAPARLAMGRGATSVTVPLTALFAHDLEQVLARANRTTGLIYICNPNNPTGTLTPRADLETFLQRLKTKCPVIVDEAYHHFVSPSPTYSSLIDKRIDDDRLIVLRTFSKIYGLAGLRIGYALSSPKIAKVLSPTRLSLGINVIGAKAAKAALKDVQYVRVSAKRNIDERQEFYNQANARMNRWIDSQTNFVMMKGGLPANQVVGHFRQRGVLLGDVVNQMTDYVRVSIGAPEEMLQFWRTWDTLPSHPMPM